MKRKTQRRTFPGVQNVVQHTANTVPITCQIRPPGSKRLIIRTSIGQAHLPPKRPSPTCATASANLTLPKVQTNIRNCHALYCTYKTQTDPHFHITRLNLLLLNSLPYMTLERKLRGTVLIDKLTVVHLVKKFFTFYWTRRLITVRTTAHPTEPTLSHITTAHWKGWSSACRSYRGIDEYRYS